MIDRRSVPYGDRRLFFGPPFIGGLLGGFLGSAIFGPRPFYPPYPIYPPFYGPYYGRPPYFW